MKEQELRDKLHDYIDHADKQFLKMVYAMSKEYKNADVVGYDADGSPITKESLAERAKNASQRVKSGDFFSQDDVEKDIDNWS